MRAVVRSYSGSGSRELFDLLQERKAEIEKELRKVNGLVSYTLMRAAEGGVSVTVCKDKSGVDESVRVAKEWIQKNAASLKASPPNIVEGEVILHLT